MFVYITRKNRTEHDCDHNVTGVLVRLIKARIQMEFYFCECINDVDAFECVWCYNGALCSVIDGELVLSHCLL